MRAFRHWEIDGAVIIAIEDEELARAFRAFAYVWEEHIERPERTRRLVEVLGELFDQALDEDGGVGGRSEAGEGLGLQ